MTKPLWRLQTLARQTHELLFDIHTRQIEGEECICEERGEPSGRECEIAMLMHNIDAALGRKIKPTHEGDVPNG